MFDVSVIFKAPEVNPINQKARSIPLLNPINVYGRVFFFSWFGFMIAFWSWYAFPPLVRHSCLQFPYFVSPNNDKDGRNDW